MDAPTAGRAAPCAMRDPGSSDVARGGPLIAPSADRAAPCALGPERPGSGDTLFERQPSLRSGIEQSGSPKHLDWCEEARRLSTGTTESPLRVAATRDDRPLLFDRLVQARLEAARRLAGALLRSAPDAEDAVHDAAVRAWEHWSELRDIDRFDAWFDRILVNRCRELIRRQRVRVIEPGKEAERSLPDPTGALDQRDALRGALLRLAPDHRIVVVLRFVEDLPLSAIAERTGVPEGTVRSRLHYALRELRAAYEAAERIPGGNR